MSSTPGSNGVPAAVSATDVSRRFGEGVAAVDALCGVTVEFQPGSFTAVMGPSGSGKSTLLHVLAGLDRPTAGTVMLAGTELNKLNEKKLTLLRREKVGFIFQFFNLLPVLNAEENVALPLKIAGESPEGEWIDSLLATVGIKERRTHRPSEMSGGEQQRVAIARALISKPAVIFADEPTGNLDSTTGTEVLELLRRSVDELGQTTVMVTHDANAAAAADRVIMLSDGQIVRDLGDQTADQILDHMKELS